MPGNLTIIMMVFSRQLKDHSCYSKDKVHQGHVQVTNNHPLLLLHWLHSWASCVLEGAVSKSCIDLDSTRTNKLSKPQWSTKIDKLGHIIEDNCLGWATSQQSHPSNFIEAQFGPLHCCTIQGDFASIRDRWGLRCKAANMSTWDLAPAIAETGSTTGTTNYCLLQLSTIKLTLSQSVSGHCALPIQLHHSQLTA